MKGIILAGGKGTRLYPITKSTSKQLLPLYDKPMIYYALSTLLLAEIKEILIICMPRDLEAYQHLLGDGDRFGIKIEYTIQEEARGIADAFLIGEKFIGKDSVCLILGDNIFYGNGLTDILLTAKKELKGATIFGYKVADPREYGVVEFDKKMRAISLEEKPQHPKSDYAIPGLYFYDNSVVKMAKEVQPSDRGELEITTINNMYLEKKQLGVGILPRGIAWLDTGNPKSLLEASLFVQTIQTRQNQYVGCPEEVAFRRGFITAAELKATGEDLKKTDYGKYLIKIATEHEQ